MCVFAGVCVCVSECAVRVWGTLSGRTVFPREGAEEEAVGLTPALHLVFWSNCFTSGRGNPVLMIKNTGTIRVLKNPATSETGQGALLSGGLRRQHEEWPEDAPGLGLCAPLRSRDSLVRGGHWGGACVPEDTGRGQREPFSQERAAGDLYAVSS